MSNVGDSCKTESVLRVVRRGSSTKILGRTLENIDVK